MNKYYLGIFFTLTILKEDTTDEEEGKEEEILHLHSKIFHLPLHPRRMRRKHLNGCLYPIDLVRAMIEGVFVVKHSQSTRFLDESLLNRRSDDDSVDVSYKQPSE